jgi:hypothetical protein
LGQNQKGIEVADWQEGDGLMNLIDFLASVFRKEGTTTWDHHGNRTGEYETRDRPCESKRARYIAEQNEYFEGKQLPDRMESH